MSIDLNTKDGQKSFIEDYLDELLAGINESYGPILLKELQKRLEFTINEFNEEINQAFGSLKKRDENRRAKYDDLELDKKLRLLRNHGFEDRDTVTTMGYNSRLDTIQAVVANYKLKNKLNTITKKRIKNALLFDKVFRDNSNVKTVKRFRYLKEVYHLYHINVKKRDQLQQYLIKNSVDAKVHYPIPIHLQPAAKYLKYKKGDFPLAEEMANTSMSLPVHEFIKESDIKYVANLINNFFKYN